MSADARYLWLYCFFPPSDGKTLAVADLEKGTVNEFRETQFTGESPYVTPETGEVYWGCGPAVYHRGPDPDSSIEMINRIPEEIIAGRRMARIATHLTRSADGKEFFVDAAIGMESVFGSLPLDGSDYRFWYRFNFSHNHAQFSPTDPDMVLFAMEHHRDQHPVCGRRQQAVLSGMSQHGELPQQEYRQVGSNSIT
ncbi:MAG: hypothetical protein R6V03_02075 [Kiritimatiellia bacterium]